MRLSLSLALTGAFSSALAVPTKTSEPHEPTMVRRGGFEEPEPTDYPSYMVYYHNMHRFNHTSVYVEWNQTLADVAAEHPYKCGPLEHYTEDWGQNLAAFGATNIDESYGAANAGGSALAGWYAESDNWDSAGYGSPDPYPSTNGGEILHFTQVVWDGTVSVGCDSAYCPDYYGEGYNGWYTTCNYYPPGNWGGEYGTNVLPPDGGLEPYEWVYDEAITY